MRIVIVRHGKYKNENLTHEGKCQIKLVSKQLEKFCFEKVFCSPLKRCTESAKIICKHLSLDYEIKEELTERWQLGHKPTNKEEQLWWDNYLNPNVETKMPKDCKTFKNRTWKVFDEIIKTYQKDVLIVAHSATTYALLNYMLKNEGEWKWQEIGNGEYVCYEFIK